MNYAFPLTPVYVTEYTGPVVWRVRLLCGVSTGQREFKGFMCRNVTFIMAVKTEPHPGSFTAFDRSFWTSTDTGSRPVWSLSLFPAELSIFSCYILI